MHPDTAEAIIKSEAASQYGRELSSASRDAKPTAVSPGKAGRSSKSLEPGELQSRSVVE